MGEGGAGGRAGAPTMAACLHPPPPHLFAASSLPASVQHPPANPLVPRFRPPPPLPPCSQAARLPGLAGRLPARGGLLAPVLHPARLPLLAAGRQQHGHRCAAAPRMRFPRCAIGSQCVSCGFSAACAGLGARGAGVGVRGAQMLARVAGVKAAGWLGWCALHRGAGAFNGAWCGCASSLAASERKE